MPVGWCAGRSRWASRSPASSSTGRQLPVSPSHVVEPVMIDRAPQDLHQVAVGWADEARYVAAGLERRACAAGRDLCWMRRGAERVLRQEHPSDHPARGCRRPGRRRGVGRHRAHAALADVVGRGAPAWLGRGRRGLCLVPSERRNGVRPSDSGRGSGEGTETCTWCSLRSCRTGAARYATGGSTSFDIVCCKLRTLLQRWCIATASMPSRPCL